MCLGPAPSAQIAKRRVTQPAFQCGHRLNPADKSVASINDCPWCVFTVRAGRDRCVACGRATDPHGAAIPFWEGT